MPDLVRAREIGPCPFCGGECYLQRSYYESSNDLEDGSVRCDVCYADSGVSHSHAELEDAITRWNLLSSFIQKMEAKKKKKENKVLTQQEIGQLLLELECQ